MLHESIRRIEKSPLGLVRIVALFVGIQGLPKVPSNSTTSPIHHLENEFRAGNGFGGIDLCVSTRDDRPDRIKKFNEILAVGSLLDHNAARYFCSC